MPSWTPRSTPPATAGMPLVWVRDHDGREWACFSYFLPDCPPCLQWTIECDIWYPVEVLFWMEVGSPHGQEGES